MCRFWIISDFFWGEGNGVDGYIIININMRKGVEAWVLGWGGDVWLRDFGTCFTCWSHNDLLMIRKCR